VQPEPGTFKGFTIQFPAPEHCIFQVRCWPLYAVAIRRLSDEITAILFVEYQRLNATFFFKEL
jgi:hypothetical protein